MRKCIGAVALAIAAAGTAGAEPAFDPRSLRDAFEGPPTRVLVLGTPHISAAGEEFEPEVLEPLLARLAAFSPDVVAVESLSGESAFLFEAFQASYPGVVEDFARRIVAFAALARASTRLDMPAADAEARRLLRALPAAPTASQRRRLAAHFAAAGDPFSARVQWLRLPQSERRRGDGVSRRLAGALDRLGQSRNESFLVGSVLAARVGLERVHAIDDHAAADILVAIRETLEAHAAGDPEFAALHQDQDLQRLATAAGRLRTPAEALATYRELNARAASLKDPEQWRYWLGADAPAGTGRARVAEWEARNLRMVANLREAVADRPGGAAVVIVGSAHKPYFEAYLDLLPDIAVIDAEAVLR